MPNKELPPFDVMVETLRRFGPLVCRPANISGWSAEMEGVHYHQGVQLMACIGWGDNPNEALVHLYELVRDEPVLYNDRAWKLDNNNVWRWH